MISHEQLVTFVNSSIDNFVSYKEGGVPASEEIPLFTESFNPSLHTKTGGIPAVIMQTAPVHNKSRDSIKEYLHHWRYLAYDDHKQTLFMARYFSQFLDVYDNLTNAEKREMFIYGWLYTNGGIYIAPRYELLYNIDMLFDKYPSNTQVFLTSDDNGISKNFFASKVNCGLWMDLMSNIGQKTITDFIGNYKTVTFDKNVLCSYGTCKPKYNKAALMYIDDSYDVMKLLKCYTGGDDTYVIGIVLIVVIFILLVLIFFFMK